MNDNSQSSAEGMQPYHADGTSLSEKALSALARNLPSMEDLKLVRKLDGDVAHDDGGPGTALFAKKVLDAYKDDMFSLHLAWIGEEEDGFWGAGIRDLVLEEIFKQCKSLPMLILLYKSVPGEVQPGVNDDFHQTVVEKMIEVCGDDLKKLFILLKHLHEVDEFQKLIQKRINEIAEKKKE